MEITWIFIAVLFGVAEAMTAQLVSIWFVGGSVAALITSMLGQNMVVQFSVFVAVSAILLVATRPIVKKFTKAGFIATNADSQIGKKIIITQRVDNLEETGEAKINGITWSVRSEDGTPLEAGDCAVIKRIDGVKLIVEKEPNTQVIV